MMPMLQSLIKMTGAKRSPAVREYLHERLIGRLLATDPRTKQPRHRPGWCGLSICPVAASVRVLATDSRSFSASVHRCGGRIPHSAMNANHSHSEEVKASFASYISGKICPNSL